jgi:hypothetical protein
VVLSKLAEIHPRAYYFMLLLELFPTGLEINFYYNFSSDSEEAMTIYCGTIEEELTIA